MEEYDIVGLQARDITTTFIMAINGAFFVSRKVGVNPMPCDIEVGKRNIHTASYLFIKSLNSLINIYDSGEGTQVTQDKLNSIAVQLIQKGNKAVSTGISNGAAELLGNSAHGAFGQLVGRAAQSVDLSVKDSSGRTWKDPAKLVQTIVRDHLYQQELDFRIQRLREEGETFFMVDDQGYSLNMFDELRPTLFHPNSTKLPERFNVSTKP